VPVFDATSRELQPAGDAETLHLQEKCFGVPVDWSVNKTKMVAGRVKSHLPR
jgi:hypothetical protein